MVCGGNELNPKEQAASMAECMDRCVSIEGCIAVVYRQGNGYCYPQYWCEQNLRNVTDLYARYVTAIFGKYTVYLH